MANFVDRVVLHLRAGNGGHGVASVHREKFKPLGGPDGGNGGRGGDIVLRVDPQVTTLIDYHHSPHRSAPNGKPGEGSERNGAQVAIAAWSADRSPPRVAALIADRVPVERASDMPDAVRRAAAWARAGDVVILAPAAASWAKRRHSFPTRQKSA